MALIDFTNVNEHNNQFSTIQVFNIPINPINSKKQKELKKAFFSKTKNLPISLIICLQKYKFQ